MSQKPFNYIWWDSTRAHLDTEIAALEKELKRKRELKEYAAHRERCARSKVLRSKYAT